MTGISKVIMLIARMRPTKDREPGPRGRQRILRPKTIDAQRSTKDRERRVFLMGLSCGTVVNDQANLADIEAAKIGPRRQLAQTP